MRQNLSLMVEVYADNTEAHVLWTNYGFMLPIMDRFYIRNCLVSRSDLIQLASLQQYYKEADEERLARIERD